MSNFDQIQGGETGESFKGALTVEPTQELIKVAGARRVARLFGLLGVEPAWRERRGYAPCDLALSRPKKYAATSLAIVFQHPVEIAGGRQSIPASRDCPSQI
jgi:hypothetical protein